MKRYIYIFVSVVTLVFLLVTGFLTYRTYHVENDLGSWDGKHSKIVVSDSGKPIELIPIGQIRTEHPDGSVTYNEAANAGELKVDLERRHQWFLDYAEKVKANGGKFPLDNPPSR